MLDPALEMVHLLGGLEGWSCAAADDCVCDWLACWLVDVWSPEDHDSRH